MTREKNWRSIILSSYLTGKILNSKHPKSTQVLQTRKRIPSTFFSLARSRSSTTRILQAFEAKAKTSGPKSFFCPVICNFSEGRGGKRERQWEGDRGWLIRPGQLKEGADFSGGSGDVGEFISNVPYSPEVPSSPSEVRHTSGLHAARKPR